MISEDSRPPWRRTLSLRSAEARAAATWLPRHGRKRYCRSLGCVPIPDLTADWSTSRAPIAQPEAELQPLPNRKPPKPKGAGHAQVPAYPICPRYCPAQPEASGSAKAIDSAGAPRYGCQSHQSQARRVQRASGQRDADQPRACCHHLRVQARRWHQDLSRITTLTEDLCMGLQAESILIERIPGKPTLGIEVPNTRRESHQPAPDSSNPTNFVEAPAFGAHHRSRQRHLRAHPHLRTRWNRCPTCSSPAPPAAGKSVMLNTLIMSVHLQVDAGRSAHDPG